MGHVGNVYGDFLNYAADTLDLMHLTEEGAQALIGRRGLNFKVPESVEEMNRELTQQQRSRLQHAEDSAAAEELEIQRGFPLKSSGFGAAMRGQKCKQQLSLSRSSA